MGYEIYREVKRYAPGDLDTGELALLLVLADEANEITRECFPGMDELSGYMRMGSDGIGKICQRLAARGLEVRVVVDKDKAGRPVYARRGQRTTYRIPHFAPVRAGERSGEPRSDQTPNARTSVRPNAPLNPDHGTTEDDHRPDAGTANQEVRPDAGTPLAGPRYGPLPQFPQEELLSSSQRIVRNAGLGLTADEEKELIAWVNAAMGHKGPGWWRTVTEHGDLPSHVAAWRAATTAVEASAIASRGCAACGRRFTPQSGDVDPCCPPCRDGEDTR